MKEEIQFRLGDSVYFPYHGYGTIIGLHNDGREYPIEVRWEESTHGQEVNTFTKDGFLTRNGAEGNVPPDSKLRDKLTVVDKSPLKKKGKMAEESKIKVGDRVRSREFGVGVVDEVLAPECPYPITVYWSDGTYSSFTLEGHYYPQRSDAEKDITLLGGEYTVEEDKIKTDAINPSHYRVKGIPEAIEIMEHLMTKEQLEGFLWGNILKYAYRYGRKGDKKETAGKIEWYAKKLKEVVGNATV